MKKLIVLFALAITFTTVYAQNVAINADASLPNSSAMLDVKSTNKGMLIPRVALTATTDVTTIANPAISLLVYNTATIPGAAGVSPGYYYWTGAAWVQLALIKEYAYIYNTGSIVVNSGVPFNTNGNMSRGFLHAQGSSSIIINNSGTYKIEFSVTANESTIFNLIKNGLTVAGSTYFSAAISQQNTGMVIVDLLPGDVIQLTTASGNATLPGAGAVVNASIIFTQL